MTVEFMLSPRYKYQYFDNQSNIICAFFLLLKAQIAKTQTALRKPEKKPLKCSAICAHYAQMPSSDWQLCGELGQLLLLISYQSL